MILNLFFKLFLFLFKRLSAICLISNLSNDEESDKSQSSKVPLTVLETSKTRVFDKIE